MATKSLISTTPQSFEDFQPSSNWVREEDVDTLVLHLPDFKKEQLRVQIDSRGKLKISGERPLEDNRWRRFYKEFSVSKNTNTNDISAKFLEGLLYVKLPKQPADILEHEQPELTQDGPADQNAMSEQKPTQVTESVTGNAYKPALGGLALKLKKHKELVIGVVIALGVAIALGIYGVYVFRSSGNGDGN